MKGSRFNPPRSKFGIQCSMDNCTLEYMMCKCIMEDGKICGQLGHPDFYKCDDEHVIPVIEHSHFLPDKDIGRNVIHRVGKPIYYPEHMRVYTWRTYRGPDRWKKIPKEIRKALGWEDERDLT